MHWKGIIASVLHQIVKPLKVVDVLLWPFRLRGWERSIAFCWGRINVKLIKVECISLHEVQ